MTQIIASILSPNYSYEEMRAKISKLRGLMSDIQIDLCDGIFVKAITWPFNSGGFEDYNFQRLVNEEEGMPYWQDFDFELDLMVSDAVENFDMYLKMGPKGIIFHLEAMPDLVVFKEFLEGIDPYIRDNIKMGIAFRPSMSLDNVYPFINIVDFIQIMGNDQVGVSGVSLDERVYDILRSLRQKYSDLPITVDIGITKDTAPLLVEAGATKLVTGSAIFKADDIISAIEYFKNL